MKHLYNEQGLPFPKKPDYYSVVSDNIKPADEVVCYAPTEGYEKVFESVLAFAYEFLGPEASAIYFNQIVIRSDSSNFSAGDKALLIPEVIKSSVNIQNLPNMYPTLVHEFMHIMQFSNKVMTLEQQLNTDLYITKAVSKNGILKTFDEIYEYGGLYCETPEEVTDNNFIMLIGRQVVSNSDSVLVEGEPISMKIKEMMAGNKNNGTNWEFYKIGEQILEAIKPDPENIPEELKRIISAYGLEVEGWAEISNILFYPEIDDVQQPYASDLELHNFFIDYMELATGRKVDLNDLKNRVRHPSGNLLPHKIVIGQAP